MTRPIVRRCGGCEHYVELGAAGVGWGSCVLRRISTTEQDLCASWKSAEASR
jgi:hypothetical protein